MAIVLVEESLPARTTKQGSGSFALNAGQSLKIETFPHGEEILGVEVPAGKTWTVTVNVVVMET